MDLVNWSLNDRRGNRRFRGPGHQAVLRDGARDYLVYHAYDAEHDGRATLRIAPIEWTADGWPAVLPWL